MDILPADFPPDFGVGLVMYRGKRVHTRGANHGNGYGKVDCDG